ncbi:trehalose-specific PTS system II [Catellicoccus marimammalium M35/04/3]|uniref:PTS system sucrose-specific EIIBCA component n=2 Tax=Catellicoccus TaxID=300418 RepID=K8Z8W1_9ENTE|nr:trehalose-specific PTS system II [Catellicoccus marimammalium M35/04/3]
MGVRKMKKQCTLFSPVFGQVIELKDTKDPVFSSGMMGKGLGVEPSEDNIYSPVNGTITMIAETKHAIGITTEEGIELLIHIGIDTVKLKGEGFNLSCQVGSEVKVGDLLGTVDFSFIKEKGYASTIMLILTNSIGKEMEVETFVGEKKAKEPIFVASWEEEANENGKAKPKKKDYQLLAQEIIASVGGKENINNVVHCFTRLRFYLKDESIAQTEKLQSMSGVIDVIQSGGQYQVVIGQEVDVVFDKIIQQLGTLNQEVVEEPKEKNPLKRGMNQLIGVITGSMSPVVGIIAASGIIKGILALLTLPQLGSIMSTNSEIYITISAMADAAFFFLPVLVGFSAAKRLGGDPIVTATIGAFLTYPQIVEWGMKGKEMFEIGGLSFNFINYTYSIFPMILAAWLVKVIGNKLKEWLPSYLKSILTPLLTLLLVCTITLVVTGPVIQGIANLIADGITWLVSASGWLGGLIIGGFYQLLVIFGLHWGVVPLIAQQIASTGETPLNAIISITMVAQGAAVLAVAMKSRKTEMKELGFAGAISAFCGITEPAIYGVNLRYKKVFISGLIGSACGGLITGLMHGTMYGFTGSLIGFSSFFNPQHPTDLHSFYAFLISSAVAIVVSFVITWVWGYSDDMTMGQKVEKKKRP